MLAGASIAEDGLTGQTDINWSQTVAGPWLAQTLAALRSPERLARIDPVGSGTLRPYQQAGVRRRSPAARADESSPFRPLRIIGTMSLCLVHNRKIS